jgi:hypothetical protein
MNTSVIQRLSFALVWTAGLVLAAGCNKPTSTEGGKPPSPISGPAGGPSAPDDKGGQSLKGQALINSLSGERKGVAVDLQLLGLAYITFAEQNGKSPAKLEEVKRFYSTDNPKRLEQNLRDNIVIVWNAKNVMKPGMEKVLVAYESKADQDGKRLVAKGNGELVLMGEAEFQEALKAAQK